MESYLSKCSWNKVQIEGDNTTPEQKLWRAVLNQALLDAFDINTIWICEHEKQDVDNFFRTRTKEFDDLCDHAGLDPTRLWKKIQRLKGVKAGFISPEKTESNVLSMFNQIKEKRKQYTQSHWRNAHVG